MRHSYIRLRLLGVYVLLGSMSAYSWSRFGLLSPGFIVVIAKSIEMYFFIFHTEKTSDFHINSR